MSGKAIAARLAATQLLHAVLFDGRRLSGVLASPDNPLERLVPQDRARAQALSTGVLRHLGRIDAILERYLEKPPAPRALQALRVAAFEMLAENIPSHAAVNAAVEIVRGSHKAARQAGLVNAVARKLAREGGEIWQQQEPQSLPSWLATPIRKNFGAPALGAIEAAHEAGGTLDITLRDETLLGHYRDALSAIPVPTGSLRLTRKTQISALPGFAQGAWWVQDAAAALAVRLLGDIRDQRILDICAAPGGKTMQLAAAGAEVSALDVSASRAERLRENLARTGLRADVIVADARDWSGDTPFDAVLLDAPCSATGTIRRHPDLPFVKAGADLSALFQLQSDLIDAALGHLKPGGRLVFCTCSLLPREGETQALDALSRHECLRVPVPDTAKLGVEADWLTPEGGLRLRPDYWPEIGGMDGFYMIAMEKTG